MGGPEGNWQKDHEQGTTTIGKNPAQQASASRGKICSALITNTTVGPSTNADGSRCHDWRPPLRCRSPQGEPPRDAAGLSGPWRKTLRTQLGRSATDVTSNKQLHLTARSRPAADQPTFQSAGASSETKPPEYAPSLLNAPASGPTPRLLSDEFGEFEPFVDEATIGRFLGLEPRRVLEMTRAGQITAHPIGGIRKTWRFRVSEVAADFDRLKKPARATMPAAVPGTKERNRLG